MEKPTKKLKKGSKKRPSQDRFTTTDIREIQKKLAATAQHGDIVFPIHPDSYLAKLYEEKVSKS